MKRATLKGKPPASRPPRLFGVVASFSQCYIAALGLLRDGTNKTDILHSSTAISRPQIYLCEVGQQQLLALAKRLAACCPANTTNPPRLVRPLALACRPSSAVRTTSTHHLPLLILARFSMSAVAKRTIVITLLMATSSTYSEPRCFLATLDRLCALPPNSAPWFLAPQIGLWLPLGATINGLAQPPLSPMSVARGVSGPSWCWRAAPQKSGQPASVGLLEWGWGWVHTLG